MPGDRHDTDVAIVGSGFGGSLTALALRGHGLRVTLVERGRHPRFAIGESSTPLANLLIEELADRYALPRVRALSKWGTWRRAWPEVHCGLKRGFSFFFHRPGEPFADTAARTRQLLVAASPHDAIADTHWYRAEVDQALAGEAVAAGAALLEDTDLERIRVGADGVALEGRRAGRPVTIAAGFVIDASGPRGFLAGQLGLARAPSWLPPTQALYTHFEGVARWEAVMAPEATPPYPVDAAAVHHVFPGGWIWVLRFDHGVTSAGAALTDRLAAEIRAADGEAAWRRLLDLVPSVRATFREARPRRPFVHAPRIGFRVRAVHGARWALLPSAAGAIDPLLSTGFPLTLLGIGRLVAALTAPAGERAEALRRYADATLAELDATEQLVAALYAAMDDPPLFTALAKLYFAAAAYSEAARRLGRPELAPGFLLHAHPVFGPELAAVTALARGRPRGDDRLALVDRMERAIAPFDTTGLLDRSRRGWHPALASDLIASAGKLQAGPAEIEQLLVRSGFARPGPARDGGSAGLL